MAVEPLRTPVPCATLTRCRGIQAGSRRPSLSVSVLIPGAIGLIGHWISHQGAKKAPDRAEEDYLAPEGDGGMIAKVDPDAGSRTWSLPILWASTPTSTDHPRRRRGVPLRSTPGPKSRLTVVCQMNRASPFRGILCVRGSAGSCTELTSGVLGKA